MSDPISNEPPPVNAKTNKKRKRPRTKAIRIELKNKIESALLLKKSPILHLFKAREDTDLIAPFDEVLPVLGYQENSSVKKLTKYQLRSISNKSRIFKIVGTDEEPLQLVFDSRNRENLEDKTVYMDNLPLSCSAEQLRRRAGVFGTVVHVHMPVVNRLRRRHCIGVEAPLNSGFAFVQFSSKTAVRRFCTRYAANCHLNRTHHPKTHRKRKNQLNASTANASASQPTEQTADANKSSQLNESSSSQPRPSTGANTSESRRKRRSTEVSVSGLDSGTESDFARPMPKVTDEKKEKGDVVEKTKRKRRTRKNLLAAFSLTKFLSKLQVFPYTKYKELRREYIQLKNNNMKALKEDLRSRDLIHSESDIENIDFANRGDGLLPQPRKRKRQRNRRLPDEAGHSAEQTAPRRKKRRGRANVMKIATRLKDESFAIPYANSINY